MADAAPPPATSIWKERDYLLFWSCRFTSALGVSIESVAIGWQIYALARRSMDVEHSAFLVGMVGLAAFTPLFLLALPAGEAADRYNRKTILRVTYLSETVVAAGLAVLSHLHLVSTDLLLAAAFVFGASRAFMQPAQNALAPNLVPRELLPRSIAWNALAGQSGRIFGPALGGVLVGVSPTFAYGTAASLYMLAALATFAIVRNAPPVIHTASRIALIKEGLVYVWENRIVFGAISLDLFAVLLGGATALLPVFARDVLNVGASGFGILRTGPALGAATMSLILSSRPIRHRAGLTMFAGVAVYGVATLVFGLSKSLWLSVAALAVLGGADMLSVFVRQTLVQLITPDPMRGRVAAVSGLFVGASNELGEFESGVVARFLGPIGAAIFGGVGALIVTGLWAKLFPALRKVDRLA
ncbi:MAG TPA: MFS transporter [Caulobacteraceae bacterium]|jgi:MFS family permease|nr:MFS transporter [Caulobacteraceae bacterium]